MEPLFIVTFLNNSYSDPVTIKEIANWPEEDILDINRIDLYVKDSDKDQHTLAQERLHDD